ncbi:winged helix-turn-helix transcriptional regulator [Actinomadura rubrisoli]|uniref:Transcriptional regulator n=1 Tax=Actinomadura rubrisoli TaxID=2530368 RepID=A0A4R5AZT5_9ACTN|nr:helix-turn-helix domain-containing protein [Actinomadura rubrisoli]TDD77759.1 transcriptional regulator [Actinomadura rubrisoli]
MSPVTVAEYQACPATVVLRRAVDGLSRRVLTRTLRMLERDGLVSRTVHPRRVEYALTGLGRSLQDQLGALALWSVEHDGEIRAARVRFDARRGGMP